MVILHFAVFGNHHPEEVVGLVPVRRKSRGSKHAAIREGIESGVGLGKNGGETEYRCRKKDGSHDSKINNSEQAAGTI
jgi:hypothetical protein